jgi:hypothetical protein
MFRLVTAACTVSVVRVDNSEKWNVEFRSQGTAPITVPCVNFHVALSQYLAIADTLLPDPDAILMPFCMASELTVSGEN